MSSSTLFACLDHIFQSITNVNLVERSNSNKRFVCEFSYGNIDSTTSSSTIGLLPFVCRAPGWPLCCCTFIFLGMFWDPQNIIVIIYLDHQFITLFTIRCKNSWSGPLACGALDGIFGFAPYKMSFVSQLYSLSTSSKIIKICMHSRTSCGFLAITKAV